ncbi:MAG: hypothetical protein QOI63_1124 [Thermoplasmata archaeon]|nr:hypothetical protein [Thermoplasmata archaeon]
MLPPDALWLPWRGLAASPLDKEWLHLNVFDHATGTIGLVNVLLHGPLGDPRSLAVATALVHRPGHGWAGNVEPHPLHRASLGPCSIGLPEAGLGVHHAAGSLAAAARFAADGVAVEVRGHAQGPAIVERQPAPMGGGAIGWYAWPRLAVSGTLAAGGATLPLGRATAYHDHNWGWWPWRRGGWHWACLQAEGGSPTFVLSAVTDKRMERDAPVRLDVLAGDRHRTLAARAVAGGTLGCLDRRMPGALAALHQDRRREGLPAEVHVTAQDGEEWVDLRFRAASAAQVIAADPIAEGYAFLHEMAGTFTSRGQVAGHSVAAAGLGIMEYVL